MKKIGGGRFLQELSLFRGEVRKLFMHFAGHQVSDFKAKMHQIRFRLGSAPDPAGGAYDAPPDPLVGWGGGYPLPIPNPLGAYGASTLAPSALLSAPAAPRPSAPRSSRLRRSAASQRLKPTLLLPSGAATDRTVRIKTGYLKFF